MINFAFGAALCTFWKSFPKAANPTKIVCKLGKIKLCDLWGKLGKIKGLPREQTWTSPRWTEPTRTEYSLAARIFVALFACPFLFLEIFATFEPMKPLWNLIFILCQNFRGAFCMFFFFLEIFSTFEPMKPLWNLIFILCQNFSPSSPGVISEAHFNRNFVKFRNVCHLATLPFQPSVNSQLARLFANEHIPKCSMRVIDILTLLVEDLAIFRFVCKWNSFKKWNHHQDMWAPGNLFPEMISIIWRLFRL